MQRHQPIINFLARRLFKAPDYQALLPGEGLFLATLLLAAATSALVAIVAYRLVDVPSMAMTKRLAKRAVLTSPPMPQEQPKRLAA